MFLWLFALPRDYAHDVAELLGPLSASLGCVPKAARAAAVSRNTRQWTIIECACPANGYGRRLRAPEGRGRVRNRATGVGEHPAVEYIHNASDGEEKTSPC